MARSTDELLRELLALIDGELPAAAELRRRLHAAPELAHAEHATAAIVAEALPVASETAGTARLARVGPGAGEPVAVRAELDGLPVRERTGAAFSARGEAMHACGHDVHMAALVALARAAHQLGDDLPAPLLAVFQPSEEAYPSGARLLAGGALARAAPAAVVAAHVQPELAWGSVALDAGTVNASSDSVEITIEGEQSHAAYPHRGRDPIVAVAQVVLALHARAARALDPLAPATLNVGVIEAGAIETVIPERARARATLRAYRPEDRETLRRITIEVVEGIAAAHGCRGTAELIAGEPALANDPAIVGVARPLLASAGLATAPEWRSVGSDDFAFFGELAPIAMAFVGLAGAPSFDRRPLHHPELLPPQESVAAVARTLAVLFVAATASLGRT